MQHLRQLPPAQSEYSALNKLKQIGFTKEFTSLEDGVEDYVKNYLIPTTYL